MLATKASKSKEDNETRTEMEESCAFNFSIQFIQLEWSQVRVQLVIGLFSLHDRSGLVLDAFLLHSHGMLAKQTNETLKITTKH